MTQTTQMLDGETQAVIDTNTLIAAQNDSFRSTFGASFGISGTVVHTQGVSALDYDLQMQIMVKVMTFSQFDEDNDPYQDHTFGAFAVSSADVGEVNLFWKIDLYDTSYTFGSPEPSNPKVTRRVLTIMLTSEY